MSLHAGQKKWGIGQVILAICVLLLVSTCVFPFLNVIAISLSSKSAILRGDVNFIPKEFTCLAYDVIFKDRSMIQSLFFTVELTVIYTAMAMMLTILLAYPLSRERLKGKRFFTLMVMFTMYFSGGLIPTYLNIRNLGMIDTIWALILPGVISTYNVVIMKSFFLGLPRELEEAATIDGANDFQVLFRIILPLSLPSIATLSLFYAVGKWNSFSDALYYINSRSLQPLQLKLYYLIKGITSVEISMVEGNAADAGRNVSESIESASIIFATLPILAVYPFIQKYFVQGATIGAVKG
ncbi:MAG: carbohydrate ABC transporter permease [Clostridia bacterium]|nr:carbohydrate ABC transporter permease [Clostridia bacterium]